MFLSIFLNENNNESEFRDCFRYGLNKVGQVWFGVVELLRGRRGRFRSVVGDQSELHGACYLTMYPSELSMGGFRCAESLEKVRKFWNSLMVDSLKGVSL